MALLNTKLDIRTDVKWAFTYFAIVVLLGIFMRSATVVAYPFTFNYRNIVHTHSHLALLGWVYGLLSALLVRTFIRFPQKNIDEVVENSWGIRIVNRRLLAFLFRGMVRCLSVFHRYLLYVLTFLQDFTLNILKKMFRC